MKCWNKISFQSDYYKHPFSWFFVSIYQTGHLLESGTHETQAWIWENYDKKIQIDKPLFRCKKCKKFIEKNNMMNHITSTHPNLLNSKLDNKVVIEDLKNKRGKRKSRRWVWEHFDKLSDTTLRCKLCKESIKYASNMFRHMQRIHADIYSTKVDKKIAKKKDKKTPTSRSKRRSRRWLWEHFDKINDTTLQCKLCKLPVKHSTNMLQHIRRKHSDLYKTKVEENVVIEKIKNKPLPRKRGRPHRSWVWAYFVRTSKNRATCKICDKAICSSFSTTGNLIIHLKKVHKKDAGWIWLVFEEEDDSDKYSCRICSFKCTKTEDMKNDIKTICDHLKTEHGLESGDQVSTVPDDKNKVVIKHIKDGSDQDSE
ncbi:PR domain zinc finger protein 10-like isoform X2 [Aricia agestis]|uniref:PR domain zinc finger protein 10-like isoform X2 n=1 Tax=Aricia agestis TaxID=91739 RepID=UPI001C2032F9|nr:PR domain zinc finger protein 10-like isoform X2 [Aricia agestis]